MHRIFEKLSFRNAKLCYALESENSNNKQNVFQEFQELWFQNTQLSRASEILQIYFQDT